MSPDRNISRFIFSFALIASTAGTALAQTTPTYVARQFPQPYAPLGAGSTIIWNQPVFDQSFTIPIGFTFSYYGVDYDYVEVSENGMLMFKALCGQCSFDEFCDFNTPACIRQWTPPPSQFDGLPSPSTPNKLIGAWWDDLTLDPNAANPSVIQYRTIGAAPNRTLIVEWRNIRRYNNFSGQPSVSRTSFQIQLQEASDNVRLAYGPYTQNAGDNAQWQGRVGMEDQNGTNAIIPLTCAQNQGICNYQNLTQLNNQVIEIGVPNIPELTGEIAGTPGAQPGQEATVYVTVQNVGLQPTASPFNVTVYLSSDNVIVPSTDFELGTGSLAYVGNGGSRTATITAILPANFAPGYYNVGAYIDSSNVILEATEQNNIVVGGNLFLAGADLETYFEVPPLPLPQNGSDTVSFNVTNRSSTVNNMPYRVHLSFDTALDPNDTLIASGTATLPGSVTTRVNALATVPPSITPNYYFVIVTVDPTNTLAEADEFNNQAIDFVVVGPDVTPVYAETAATSGRGASLDINLGIANNGSTLNNVEYEIFFSSDFTLDRGTDTMIASGMVDAARGVTTEVPLTVLIPTTIAPGQYNIIVTVDPFDMYPELDDFNNEAVMFNTVTLIGPDLSVESLTGDRIAFLGQPFRMTAVVANVGGEPVNGFYTSFHLSANQLCTASDPLLIEVGPTNLNEASRISLTPDIIIPANTTPGMYYLCAITDSQSLVLEDREQNNIRRASDQALVRDIAPDFVITDLLTPAIAGAGETFAVQRTLENQGNNRGTVSYDVYLTSQSGATKIALIGRAQKLMEVGEIDNGVDNVTIPADVGNGVYKVQYELDPDELVDEVFEDNNIVLSEETIEVESSQLLITTTSLPVATIGVEYQADLFAQGGSGPLSWSITHGTLPAGLSIDADTGRIFGVAETESATMITVSVTDGSLTHARTLKLTVAAPTVDLKIVSRSVPPVWVGQHYEYPMTALGGVPPYAWSVRPALPAGLTLTSSGTLAGDTSTTAASFVYTFRVEDAVGDTAEAPLAVRVLARDDALRFATLSLADGIVGSDYSEALGAENGVPEFNFSVADGTLPPGLTIGKRSDGTSELAGVPSEPGLFTFRLRVTDSRGDFDLNYFIVEIAASDSVSFVTKGLPPATLNQAYKDRDERPVSLKAIVLSGSGAIEYSIVQGALPAGMTMSMDGVLSGTPTAEGVFPFTARAYDPQGKTEDVRAFGIVVEDTSSTIPENPEDGCSCAAAPSAERTGGSLALLALGALLLVSRRRRLLAGSVGTIALALGMTSPAFAQRDAGIPMGPDAGPNPTTPIPYFISQYAETYVPRSGGTVVQTTSTDDGEAIVSLPFAFKFYGSTYNEVHVGTNGYLAFNNDAYSLDNRTFPDSNLPNGVIAAFWDDLYLGQITSQVEGTEPNRIFIIQWENMEHYPQGSGERFEFQIWLYEGNAARFEIHYGDTSNLHEAFFDASVGMEDEFAQNGESLLSCTPICAGADLAAMTDQVIRGLQDAGEDIFALRVSADVTGDPLRLFQGINFDVSSTFAAYHENPVGPFVYSLYLLGQNELTPSTPPIFVSAETTIGAYQTLELIDSISIPLTTATGRYRLAMEVDSASQVAEPNETNNFVIGSQTFLIGARQPDLSVMAVTPAAGPISPGSTVQVGLDLANIGNLDASAGWTLVVSQNRAPSINDVQVAASTLDEPLPLGETVHLDVDVTIPADLSPGRYYFGAIVDPGNGVAELIEINNNGRSSDPFDIALGTVSITTGSLPLAYVNNAYSTRLVAEGGNGSYVWELVGGSAPAGLTFVGGPVGELRGTPTEIASTSLTIKVTSDGLEDTKTLMLDVRELSGPLTIVTRNLLPGVVGQPYPPIDEEQRIIAVGGEGPSTFTLISGGPAGLTLDEDGTLHGVPESRGSFTLEIAANDGASTVMRSIPLTIIEPGRLSLIVGALPNATLGEPYSYTFFTVGQAQGEPLFFDYVAGDGNPPPGLSIERNSGMLTGTPTFAGVYTFSVQVVEGTQADAPRDTASVTVIVDAPEGSLSITPNQVPDAVVGQNYIVTFEARQGVGPFNWTVDEAAALPADLKFEMIEVDGINKLRLAGKPAALPSESNLGTNTGGVVSFLVKLVDAEGRHAEQAIALRVIEAPAAGGGEDEGGCGCSAAASNAERSIWLMPLLLGWALTLRARRRK